jgi:hypothetical protein
VVGSAFKATTANIMFGNIKNIKNTSGIHVNSRFERDIGEAARGCFFKFCIRVHSAIHLHCSGDFYLFSVYSFCIYFFKKTSFTLSCKQYFFSRKTSIERIKFTRTVISN